MAYVTYKDVIDREQNARRMMRRGTRPVRISTYPEAWSVRAEDGNRSHIVTKFEDKYNCTCEDYRYHGGVLLCKHINVVKFTNGDFNAQNATIPRAPQYNQPTMQKNTSGDVVINITIPRDALRSIVQP
jgi:hypothetical protein